MDDNIISDNSRCKVKECEDKIIKYYKYEENFNMEYNVYKKMGEKPYLAKIIKPDFDNQCIELERLFLPNLYKYINDKNEIPKYLLNSMQKISLEFLEKNISIIDDLFKVEHIFIDDKNAKNPYGLKIIDFESCKNIKDYEYDSYRQLIISTFRELNNREEEFNEQFNYSPQEIVHRFYINKEPQICCD